MRVAAWFLGAIAVCIGLPATAQEVLIPRNELRPLERLAEELARSGRTEPWRELVFVLGQLGLPSRELAAVRSSGEAALARVKKPPADVARIAKGLREAVAPLSRHLASIEQEERRRQLAELLLSLDSDQVAANELMGHERWQGGWALPGEEPRARRRAEIEAALSAARKLPVPIEVRVLDGRAVADEQDGCRLLSTVLDRPVASASHAGFDLHSSRSPEQTRRILLQIMRALAFSGFISGGNLEVPPLGAWSAVLFDHRDDYERAIELAVQRGWVNLGTTAQLLKMEWVWLHDGRLLVVLAPMESQAESILFSLLDWGRLSEPALAAGYLSWVCRKFFGISLPRFLYVESMGHGRDRRSTSSQDQRVIAEREEMFRLADAGLLGGKTFLRYLVSRREDPPWSQAIKLQLGEIQGEDLLKATFVVEHLMEHGRLSSLDSKLREVELSMTAPERFEDALGEPLSQFEARWRAWLCGLSTGIAQKLSGKQAGQSPEVLSTLAKLQAIRASAFEGNASQVGPRFMIGLDDSLSEGCLAHAEYLVRHPDMATRWPDAHEENPAHTEWSADGAWAAGHSNIAPSGVNGSDAIEQWMATFYHRLPLLHPLLSRVGLGQSRETVVLDCTSMVQDTWEPWYVGWPSAGASDVPTRFVPELPNPVPGEDQSRFGYPVTLQVGVRSNQSEPRIEMRLLDGDKVVPCWYSTPQSPTYVDLAPSGSFCLIPKAQLRAATTYSVEAQFLHESRLLRWTFRTGSR